MKIICDKSELQNACITASRATASKSPITALEGIKIETGDNKITVTGYDLKKGIYTTVEAEILEYGSIVINSRLFCEMIRKLPDGNVTITTDTKNGVNVKCGRSEFNITGIDTKDYPELPVIDKINSVELPQKLLANMINQTIFAIADNDVRPVYTGSLFEIEDESLTLVSVDGYRLAKRVETIENCNIENCSFIVPGYALSDVVKICADEDEKKVLISVGTKHISFAFDSTVIITRKLEGEFLNYKKSIPASFRYKIKVQRSDMISSIDRVALIVAEKNTSPVRMTFENMAIKMLCATPIGKAEDVCICDGDGEGLEIGFNDRYFMDALKAAGSEEINVCINTPSSPCIIEAADESGKYTYMILPVRLRAGE